MSKGKEIWNSTENGTKTDLFGITKEGVLVVEQYSAQELKDLNVQEALSFGPTLKINRKMINLSLDGGIAPRTVIGQREDGAIILLVIDGRILGSYGATYKELQEVIYTLGDINAINLDGGKSTTIEIINSPSNSMGERALPTAVIVKQKNIFSEGDVSN